ncbi:hypothetical protein FHR24_002786 [Wenyingzhuangia heitensis]|uniref:AB hydrolase-1 domain-containing protein n=1 Tax=Wenyingzhuangia heitensis TaxID=1487859 RepID=A0ABX0UBU7_9FLAO|nr:alpha/beta hydrolase [Wenyingzhuangia heitensis]NIJ46302.1 hypothetical protein [Wenyingzhuangia heitensis]
MKKKHILIVTLMIGIAEVSAQFGDVKNIKNLTALEKSKGGKSVVFNSESDKIAANLYLPSNYNKENNYSAIVVVAPQGGLKEQTAGFYAKKLSKKGFISIAFDHRSYGQSGGAPRHYESPQWKAEDIKNAVSYMGTIAGVNKENIAVLAICSGAGYGLMASVNDARVKAFATVSGVFNFRERETGLNDVDNPKQENLDTFRDKMKQSAIARQKYFETGVMEYSLLVPDLTENTGSFWSQGYDYYRTERGFVNGWENKRSKHSFEARLSTNATTQYAKQLSDLGIPFLAIAGDKAFTYPFSQRVIATAIGDKELYTIPNATHFDLYDNELYVDKAVQKLTLFFKEKI